MNTSSYIIFQCICSLHVRLPSSEAGTYRVGSQKGNMKYARMCTRATITTHIERASSKVDGRLHSPIIKVQTEIAVKIKFSSGTKSECVKKSQKNRRGGLGWGRGVEREI